MPAPQAPTSRQLKRADSDRRILEAARALFDELGYERCTVRAIAERAAVDPALVVRRFGGKDQLFVRVVQDRWPLQLLTAPSTSSDELVQHWVSTFIANVDDGEELTAVATTLQAALTQPDAADLLRTELFEHAAGEVLATAIAGPHAAERAQLAAAALIGVTLARRILHAEPLASLDAALLMTYLQRMLSAVLTPEAG